MEIFSKYNAQKENFQNVIGILLTRVVAGEMGCTDTIIYDHGRARGQSVPSDTDAGTKTVRRSSMGQDREKKQAQRNVIICMRCRLALLPARC